MARTPVKESSMHYTRIVCLRIWSLVGLIVVAAALLNVLGALAPVIEFLAVGALIAFVESPIVNWLEHKGCPRGAGALIGLIVVVAVIAGVILIIGPVFVSQFSEILVALPAQLRTLSNSISDFIQSFKTISNSAAGSYIDEALSNVTTLVTGAVSDLAGEVGRGVVPFISNVASQLFVIFLGLVLAYWLACDYPRIHREIAVVLGDDRETDYRFMVAILSRSVGGYMRSMIITSFINGVLAWIGFVIVGHPYAALMGVLTGVLHLVPVVGPFISSVFATVVGLIYDPMLGLWTLIITMVAQNVTDNVISPKVMQSSVQVHPAMSLTALVIGSTLMGAIGMVIAVPLCAALKGLFIFYFEKNSGTQIVSYKGAIFQGTPYHDADGKPVPAFDALGDDKFVADSELIFDEDVDSEAEAVPRPELDNPWGKLMQQAGLFTNAGRDDDMDDRDGSD